MEIWDVYDENECLTGEKLMRGQVIPRGQYHLVCEVLVRHIDGSYLCMTRAKSKQGYPGWPETTAGGSALAGEDKFACVRRELLEETGLECEIFTQIGRKKFENVFFYSFLCTLDCDKDSVRLREGETEGYRWLTEEEFIEFANSGKMILSQRSRYDAWLRKMGYIRGKKIYLVRHGQDDERIRGGWSQHPLTKEGLKQAEGLAERFNYLVSALYASDLKRAMQTAEPLSRKLELPILPVPQFRETNNGELAGMKHELACEKYPGIYWSTLGWEERYPGGESPREFYDRIKSGWEEFSREAEKREGDTLLVTHGGVINVILCLLNGETYTNKVHRKIPFVQVITLIYEDGKWKAVET